MSSRLVPTPELLQDAKNFKGEFLVRIFWCVPSNSRGFSTKWNTQ